MDCKYCGKYIGDEPIDDFCDNICRTKWIEEIEK